MTDSKIVKDTGRPKPPAAGKGRPKGATNKLTKTVKEAIEAAFDQVGGPDYLAEMAREQPVAFMTLLGKILPQQVNMNAKGEGLKIIIERAGAKTPSQAD
jgi:hypothetical protein